MNLIRDLATTLYPCLIFQVRCSKQKNELRMRSSFTLAIFSSLVTGKQTFVYRHKKKSLSGERHKQFKPFKQFFDDIIVLSQKLYFRMERQFNASLKYSHRAAKNIICIWYIKKMWIKMKKKSLFVSLFFFFIIGNRVPGNEPRKQYHR